MRTLSKKVWASLALATALSVGVVGYMGAASTATAAVSESTTGATINPDGSVNLKGITLSRKSVDNLVYASAADPAGFDPAQVGDYDSSAMVSNIFEGLLRFKSGTNEVEPALAESYTVSDDGLHYTFKLRKGVKFTDGTPFNAQAVKMNYDRQSPEKRNPLMSYAPLVFADVKDVKVIDDYTVRFDLDKPSTPFIANMAMVFAGPVVSPKVLEKGNEYAMQHPVGTGPYMLYRYDRGQQVVLTRNPAYWGPKPPVENVIYKIIPETSSRLIALKNGEADIINGIDPSSVKSVQQSGNKIFEVSGTNTNYMFFNTRPSQVTKDVAVRRAIAQSINVNELVKSLYEGYAKPAHSFLPELINGYSDKTHTVGYNPEAAKKFFKDHNIKELTILTYSTARPYNSAGGISLAESVQGYLKKVGVKANIVVYDWNTYRSRIRTDAYDIAFLGWITDNFDADNFLNFLASDDPVNNQGLWNNKEFRDLIAKGTTLPRGEKRDELYQKADQIMMDDLGTLPISHAISMVAYRPNIGGFLTQKGGSPRFSAISKTEDAK